jgi:hypothetical protein
MEAKVAKGSREGAMKAKIAKRVMRNRDRRRFQA